MTRYYKVPSDPSSYRPDDPNSYTYVDGYGFTPPPPILTERHLLQRYSNGLGFSILLYFILTAFVPFLILWGCAVFRPAIRIWHWLSAWRPVLTASAESWNRRTVSMKIFMP